MCAQARKAGARKTRRFSPQSPGRYSDLGRESSSAAGQLVHARDGQHRHSCPRTDDPAVEKLRSRQAKNFLSITMLSLGVPMILMGDQARRSQHGKNDAYCQDNETGWIDWTMVTKHAELHRFVKLLIARRLLRDVEHERERVSLNQLIRRASKAWHGVKLKVSPIWWTAKAQISEKQLQTCLQPIVPMTRTSVRKRSISCSAAGVRSSGWPRNSVLPPRLQAS